jgi:hypothetical protein
MELLRLRECEREVEPRDESLPKGELNPKLRVDGDGTLRTLSVDSGLSS